MNNVIAGIGVGLCIKKKKKLYKVPTEEGSTVLYGL